MSTAPVAVPPQHIPIVLNTSPQLSLAIVPTILTFFATIAVALRFDARRIKKVGARVDDWFCLLALIFSWTFYICNMIMVVVDGSGLNITQIGLLQRAQWIKLQVATYLIWMVAVATLQISILTFYTRVFGIKTSFRIVCYTGLGLVTAWFIGAFFSYLFTCSPVYKLWTPATPGKCGLGTTLCASTGIIHIIIDLSILLLPLPLIWDLHMGLGNKIILTAVFTLGLFASICSIMRLECLVTLLPGTLTNPTYALWKAILFQFMETPVGIVCACIPTLHPVWTKFTHSWIGSRVLSLVYPSSKSGTDGSGDNSQKKSSAKWDSKGSKANRSHEFKRLDRGNSQDTMPSQTDNIPLAKIENQE